VAFQQGSRPGNGEQRGSKELALSLLEQYGEMAYGMLNHMYWGEGEHRGWFSFKARPVAGEKRYERVGVSPRYSLIAWIGMFADSAERAKSTAWWPISKARLEEDLRTNQSKFTVGELGLVSWLADLSGETNSEWAELARVHAAKRLAPERRWLDTLELGWLLCGSSRTGATELAARTLELVLESYNPETKLFAFGRYRSGSSFFASRYRNFLGSFASQVYSLVGLSDHVLRMAGGDRQLRKVIADSSTTLASLQGSAGEWWWVYDVRSGEVVQDYPVYSIHQDGMGPMALLAAMQTGASDSMIWNVQQSLTLLQDYRDSKGNGFLEDGWIWRSANRDVPGPDPADLPFGITPAERQVILERGRPEWLRSTKRVSADTPTVMLREARPYCPGWILYALALARATFR
jgi:hypothetical protein